MTQNSTAAPTSRETKTTRSPTYVLADAQAHGSEQRADIVYESLHYVGASPFVLETLEVPRDVAIRLPYLPTLSIWRLDCHVWTAVL
jgi:hypothetical protein